MNLYTIGFTKRSAESFFEALRTAGVRRLLDVRLNNRSQLAGFTKAGDLAYFLRELCGAEYEHRLDLAPTAPLLDGYRKGGGSWEAYEKGFRALLAERRIERLARALFDGPTALLCSEPTAEHCHRRLVAEHLAGYWPEVAVHHL